MVYRLLIVCVRLLSCVLWAGAIALFLYAFNFFDYCLVTKEINVFTWSLALDPKVVIDFEEKTGIRVNLSYYESSDELISKLKVTGGKGYDLIIPSDYSVKKLIDDGMLKKLDKERLPFITTISPYLKNHYYDPDNTYSLPFIWGFYGIGWNSEVVQEGDVKSWKAIFGVKEGSYPICMTDGPREALMLAGLYLFGAVEALRDGRKVEVVKHLLLQQKNRVQVYSDIRAEEMLLARSVPLAVVLSANVQRVFKAGPYLQFTVPHEGTFLVIDSLVIPVISQKDDLIYEFIRYLYSPEVMKHHFDQYGFLPPVQKVMDELYSDPSERMIPLPTYKELARMHFFKDILDGAVLNDVWTEVMSQ